MYLVYDFGVDFDSCLEMLLSLSTVSLLCTLFDVSTAFLWSDTLSFRDKNQESVRRIWKVLLFFPLSEAVMPLFNVLKQMAERRLREARQRIWICFAWRREKWKEEEKEMVQRRRKRRRKNNVQNLIYMSLEVKDRVLCLLFEVRIHLFSWLQNLLISYSVRWLWSWWWWCWPSHLTWHDAEPKEIKK